MWIRKYAFQIGMGVIIVMAIFSLHSLTTQIPAADEIIFIRITDHLPDYSSKLTWFSLDGKTDPNHDGVIDPATGRDDNPFYEPAYETKIWHHPPFANYLAWPFVKMFYHGGTNDEIREGVANLRVVAWFMLSFCVGSCAYIIRRHNKNDMVFLISTVPLASAYVLFTQWGNNWFYHDIFMLTSLCIALLLRKTKYEKYIYIPLFIMVGCKGIGFLFLLPFVLENKKTLWCLTAWIPFIIMVYLATGDPFYRIEHWLGMRELTAQIGTGNDIVNVGQIILYNIKRILVGASHVWLFLGIMALPFFYTVYGAIKKRITWFYPSLYFVAMIAGLCFSAAYYQMQPMMVSGILLMACAVILYGRNRNAKIFIN